METYISLLRGINVSGKHLIKMEDLRNLLTQAGLQQIKTYIQSGNLVYQSSERNIESLNGIIEKTIFNNYKFEVPVITLKLNDLEKARDENPFLIDPLKTTSKMHISFLKQLPETENQTKLLEIKSPPDEIIIKQKLIYLYCPEGYGNTKYSSNTLDKILKVVNTSRNWKTTNELIHIATELKKK
ncbi:MAG: DUF1697 domain-containing protein [Saprospiraceae bacterium]|jgi:uncharacterized protein (DUF1697 family)|nr:DUF1697 domain-containing protein [Saprospiraceae bacterium]